MAEDAVKSKTSFITRSAKNSSLDIVKDGEVGGKVRQVMTKRSKNQLSRSQLDLQDILPSYTPEKNEFSLIVLAMVEAFS